MARDHREEDEAERPRVPHVRSAGKSIWHHCRRACSYALLACGFAWPVQAQTLADRVTAAQQTVSDIWTALQQTQVLLTAAQQQSANDTATILALRTQVAALQAQLAGVPACPPVVVCPVCPAPVVCPVLPPPPVVTPPPPAPAGTVALAWDPVSVATSYRVYFGTASGVYLQGPGQGIQTTLTTMTVGGLSPIRYFFVATAVNANGESGFSNEVFKDVGAVVPPPPPPPPAPPPTGASADCSRMPPAAQILAGDGAKFTLVPVAGAQPQVWRNGLKVTNALSDFVTIKGGTVCQFDDGAWECWSGAAPPTGKWVPGTPIACP